MSDEITSRRGLILLALHEQFPQQLTWRALLGRVRLAYLTDDVDREVSRDLAYLVAKDLVEEESAEVGRRKILAYRLTPTGVDVAEGTRQEPGITIERG